MLTDIQIINRDIAADSAGRPIRLSDFDARFRRAFITAAVEKGSFIYDRSLGCRYEPDGGELSKRKAELSINEAVARFGDTKAEVESIGETLRLKITINGKSKTEEVRVIGNV